MNRFLFTISLFINACCWSQIPDSTIVNGEKIISPIINEVILSPLNLDSKERIKYYHLRRKVHKVHPYALKAKIQLIELEEDLKYTDTRRQKRKIAKLHDKWLQNHFTDDLKKLTRSEGKVLIKLIHHETGMTGYELIKNYRNGFKAMLWQRLAKFYDGNLKTIYDPKNKQEDMWIEHILWKRRRENEAISK